MAKRRPQRKPALRAPAADHPPETNPDLLAAILLELDRQLEQGEPAETRNTLEQLVAAGHSREGARQLIAVTVAQTLIAALERGEAYRAEAFRSALAQLRAHL